jgi:outer membrane protein assembly factor BamB
VAGRLYYKEPLAFTGTAGDTVCVDLATGKEVWRSADVPALSFAYVYDLETPNYHGVRPAILFTSNFARAFDAATGSALFNVSAVPSGTNVIGPQGELIKYIFYNNGTNVAPDYYLCQWNSSRMWSEGNPITVTLSTTTNVSSTTYVNGVAATTLTPVTTTVTQVNASRGIMYDTINANTQNQSISWRNNQPGSPTIIAAFYNDILLCRNGSLPALGDNGQPYEYFAVDINNTHSTFGQVLWWHMVNQPAGNITTVSFAGADQSGYFCESYRQTSQFVFFNLRTGEYIGISDSQPALDYYGSTGPGTLSNIVAYGYVYSSAYAGVMYCYDMSTGKVLWTYGNGGVPGNTTNSGFQVPGPYPTFINAAGNGVIYTVTTEHTFETPIYKGAQVRAINATDGTELWTLSGATGEFGGESYAIADGYSNFFNSYDQQIYTLGRGPSATTVQAGPKSATLGSNVVIEGTVTDVSTGTQQNEQSARFPNGVPVASDASMKEWMGYVYQQKPMPTNFTGVPVSIDVIDSNGNYRNIGTSTTDSRGIYRLAWTPDIPGTYTVFASFAGTKGYWPSSSETGFAVMNAAPTASSYPVVNLPPIEMYIAAGVIAIIIAIAIGFAVTILVLRKRP